MATQEQARSRITKLLALANRPGTPEEGKLALDKARELAARHGLAIQRKKLVPDPFEWLTDYLGQVDRDAAEREASDHAQRSRTEQKRRRTMASRAYTLGHYAGRNGDPINAYPYSRRIVFGVDLQTEWLRGWNAGRQKEK